VSNTSPNSNGDTLTSKVNRWIEKGYEPFGNVVMVAKEESVISSISMINKELPPVSPVKEKEEKE
jgi:hypothetical protein